MVVLTGDGGGAEMEKVGWEERRGGGVGEK